MLLSSEVVCNGLILPQNELALLDEHVDVRADGLGHDELAPERVTLVELSSEADQLPHDLQE